MARLAKRNTNVQRFKEFIASPEKMKMALQDNEPPDEVKAWLKRLGLLHGVPFNYLVPNEKMLPEESIRFFQVDFNWLYALIEGACSTSHASEKNTLKKSIMAAKLQATAMISSKKETGQAPRHISGFFMRSQVVPGWPKLEVLAFDKDGKELSHVIRMDRPTPSVLLYMVEGKIDHVLIREPAVGLHFGVGLAGDKFLRYVTVPSTAPAGTQPGDQMDVKPEQANFRGPDKRTLKVNQLAESIAKTLQAHKANNAPDGKALAFTSAEFTLEMVEGTQEVKFQNISKPGDLNR